MRLAVLPLVGTNKAVSVDPRFAYVKKTDEGQVLLYDRNYRPCQGVLGCTIEEAEAEIKLALEQGPKGIG